MAPRFRPGEEGASGRLVVALLRRSSSSSPPRQGIDEGLLISAVATFSQWLGRLRSDRSQASEASQASSSLMASEPLEKLL